MKTRRHGRIVNVSSNGALGIGANTSYATSKAGLIGLTMDTAREGEPFGICVNALMPVAHTRMIEGIPDREFVAWFRRHMAPERIAAPLAYFLSRESQVTGTILSTGGGRMSRVLFATNAGVDGLESAEVAGAAVARITDTAQLRPLGCAYDELATYTAAFPFDGPGGGPALDHAAVVGASHTRNE